MLSSSSHPRFVFLGTGTSSGVPAIGCSCGVCTSADPRDNRLRTAGAVTFVDAAGHDRTVLIDTGPDLRQQCLRHGITRLDGIVYTHNHVDHTFGLDEVRRFNAVQRAPIDLYAEPHTMEALERVYAHIFDRKSNANDSFVASLIAHRVGAREVEAGTPVPIHGALFTPIRLLHGRLPVLGWRVEMPARQGGLFGGIESLPAPSPADDSPPRAAAVGFDPFPLAYCTDVSAVPPESWGRLRGLKTLVLDALRHRKHPTHFTLGQAVSVAHEVGAERTYFVHMSHDLAHEETQAGLPEGMFLAWDGLVLGGGGGQ